jgi:hypothetical protein
MKMDIKLTYRNNSNDAANSSIVIFQKSVNADYDEMAVAWKVIKNCGTGEFHPFRFPMGMQVACSDNDGNFTQLQDAVNTNVFTLARSDSGNQLSLSNMTTSSKELDVRNDLDYGAIQAGVYKDGRLLALKTNISPGEKAVFQFKPTIWIGVVSGVEEGTVMNSAVMSDVNTELSLLGIASADIVLTGGDNNPYRLGLENIRRA